MANPYIVGPPVPYSRLYGRDELIQKCYQDVYNNIWLLGRRHSGKTSVLLAIKEVALEEKKEWLPVYVTLEGRNTDADIKDLFLKDYQANLKRFELEVEYQPPAETHDFVDSVESICRSLDEHNIGLLLLLDEFEQTDALKEGKKLVQKLTGLHGILPLRTIFAAAKILRVQDAPVISPFIRLFRIESISAIPEAEARKLILQEKDAKMEIQVADEVIDQILTVTACEPYPCQYLCDKLEQDHSLRAPTDSDLTQLDPTLKQMLDLDYAYLKEGERDILLGIARGEPIDPSSVPKEAFDELIQLGYIRQINTHYTIGNHFWETWLKAYAIPETSSLPPVLGPPVVCKFYGMDEKEIRGDRENVRVIYRQQEPKPYIKEIGLPDRISAGSVRNVRRALVLSGKTPLLKVKYNWGETIDMLGRGHQGQNTFYLKNQKESDSLQPLRFRASDEVNQTVSQPLNVEVSEIKESKWTLWAVWGIAILWFIGWLWFAKPWSLSKEQIDIGKKIVDIGKKILAGPIPAAILIWLSKKLRNSIEIVIAQIKEEKIIPHSDIVSDRIRVEVVGRRTDIQGGT